MSIDRYLHLTSDSFHEALELGERVHCLEPQLALGEAVVGLILQQLHRLLHVGVGLPQCLSADIILLIHIHKSVSFTVYLNSSVDTFPASHFRFASWSKGM